MADDVERVQSMHGNDNAIMNLVKIMPAFKIRSLTSLFEGMRKKLLCRVCAVNYIHTYTFILYIMDRRKQISLCKDTLLFYTFFPVKS